MGFKSDRKISKIIKKRVLSPVSLFIMITILLSRFPLHDYEVNLYFSKNAGHLAIFTLGWPNDDTKIISADGIQKL